MRHRQSDEFDFTHMRKPKPRPSPVRPVLALIHRIWVQSLWFALGLLIGKYWL